jgi:8-oxo-dGTP pyrophosphatase MutT (NUDIX family)
VEQNRPLQNRHSPVLNLPRGFLDPGETHFEAAQRETEEEIGQIGQVFLLPGKPTNPNNTFFETWSEGEGIKWYGLKLAETALKEKSGYYSLNEEVAKPASNAAEGIMGSRFIPWTQAALLADQMTVAGVARILAFLELENKEQLQLNIS